MVRITLSSDIIVRMLDNMKIEYMPNIYGESGEFTLRDFLRAFFDDAADAEFSVELA